VIKQATQFVAAKSLPRTTEAFIENAKHAHLQTYIWKAALEEDPKI